MPNISLASCNIERSNHLDTIVPFLKKHSPDIVTLQEVMERDIPLFKDIVGENYIYTPLCNFAQFPEEKDGVYGQAIFSRHPFFSTHSEYYGGQHDPISTFTADVEEQIAKLGKALCAVEIQINGQNWLFATTHFTWTPNGEANDMQRKDLQVLFAKLAEIPEFVLTGDFNAPRGKETFDAIAAKYKDNIPAKYTSSIDPMHKAGPLPLMVDGLFTTPGYSASNVELHEGVSDHKAITATIARL